jgi:hypothetical protein
MNNKIKPELSFILERHHNDIISTRTAIALINHHFFSNVETEIEIVNKIVVEKPKIFECEFKTTNNKAICKNYKCIPSCLKKMKAEYIIFKEQQQKPKS